MTVQTPLGPSRPRERLEGFRKTSLSLITLIYPSSFAIALMALRQIGIWEAQVVFLLLDVPPASRT